MPNANEIKVKLIIDKEKEFKSALDSCFAELNKAKAQLKLTDSEYRGNANSVEALTARVEALNRIYQAQTGIVSQTEKALGFMRDKQASYGSAIDDTKNKIAANNAEITKLSTNAGENASRIKELEAENERLNAELVEGQRGYDRITQDIEKYNNQLVRSKTFQNDANFNLKQYQGYLDEARNSTDGCATSIDRFGRTVRQTGQQTQQMGQNASQAIVDFAQVLAMSRINATVQQITRALVDCTESAREFESAMALIEKTLGDNATEGGMAQLKDDIIALSYELPKSAKDIAGLAQSAAQLGIAQENVLAFAETMIMLSDASTDLDAEGASQRLAKFATVTKTTADEYNRLGSTIMKLGNSYATTEDQLTVMATKMAGAASVAGLTQPQILALAAAASSVGVEAAAGSTSLSKIIKEMQNAVATGKKLDDFAKVAGMSGEQFRKAWGENAVKAIADFISGLADVNSQGGSAIVTLNNLGITNQRVTNTILSLANNSELLYSTIETADQAWADNNALQKAAGVIYETTEAKTQRLKNAMEGLKIAVGDQLNPALGGLAEMGTDILKPITQFVNENPGLVQAIAAVVVGIGTATAALTTLGIALKAIHLLMGALSAHPVIALISAIVGVVGAIGTFIAVSQEAKVSYDDLIAGTNEAKEAFDKAGKSYEDATAAIQPTADAVNKYIDELEKLDAQTTLTRDEQARYRIVVAAINELIPDLNAQIDEQTGRLKDGTAALREDTEAWKKNAEERAKAELLAEAQQAIIDAQKEGLKLYAQLEQADKKVTAAKQNQLDVARKIVEYKGWEAKTDEELLALAQKANSQGEYLPYELSTAWGEASNKIGEAETELTTLGEAVKGNRETVASLKKGYDDLEESVDNALNTTDSMAESQDALTAAQESALEEIDLLKQAYDEAYEAARKSIDKQVDIFEGFDKKSSEYTRHAADNVLANMEEINTSLEEFNKLIEQASEMGYSSDFLSNFEDFSPENFAVLTDLLSEAPEDVQKYNDTWAKLGQNKDAYAGAIAELQTGLSKSSQDVVNTVLEMAEDVFDGSNKAGENFTNGFISAVNRKLGGVYTASYSMGRTAVRGLNAGINSHSPSRESMKSGHFFGQGFEIGMFEEMQKANEIAYEMGEGAVRALNRSVASIRATSPQGKIGATVVDASGLTNAMRDTMGGINVTPEVTVNFDYREFERGLAQYES